VLEELKMKVSYDLKKEFVLTRVMSCGSDANLFAVVDLTEGDTESCVIAAGSYVAGDGGPLQSWSTNEFSVQRGPSGITSPKAVVNKFTRSHTVALPYIIEGVLDSNTAEEYENECLNELHIRCLIAKVKGSPLKCILMELMLASNGATLSDRALTMIGKLAEKHNLNIVLDEIMTGGRTGTMLMSQTKPKAFTDRVTHVTLGKWLQVGLVLESATNYHDSTSISGHTTKRGASTIIDCRQVLLYWKEVMTNLGVAEIRRDMVLSKLRVKKDDAWGAGSIIFAPVKRSGMVLGTKNRFLPLLSVDTPIDSFICSKMPDWSKQLVNERIMAGVRQWVHFHPYADEHDQHVRKLVKFLVTGCGNEYLKTEDIKDLYIKELNHMSVSAMLRKTAAAGLLHYKLIGLKRHRGWIITTECIPTFMDE
jgi:hypothetical protein